MNTLDEVEADPQVQARKMIVELDTLEGRKVKQVGISVKLSETPGSIRSLAPTLGQHTEEVMHGLGYSDEQIEKWRADGSVK
jgi:crotonobetainyl-CoA:carnitine CoA-transferase CaiB-like acyl-CoA transferase